MTGTPPHDLGLAPLERLAVWELDDRDRVLAWSDGACHVFGWTAQEMIGSALADRLPAAAHAVRSLRGGAPGQRHVALTCQRRDGDEVEVELSLARLRDSRGAVARVCAVAAPLADRRMEQAQLRAYAEDVRRGYSTELRQARELEQSYLATVRALASAVEAKDSYTGGHIRRVHELGLMLTRELAPPEVDEKQLAYGFLLHDVGKLHVPDEVLTKPARLDDAEWRLMRRHPEEGVRILGNVPFLDGTLDVVHHHHERWDGGGYPDGLAGEDVPLGARIFAVVDTVDAMTSDRPYRSAQPFEAAVEEVQRNAGTQFDPECADALQELDADRVLAALQPQSA